MCHKRSPPMVCHPLQINLLSSTFGFVADVDAQCVSGGIYSCRPAYEEEASSTYGGSSLNRLYVEETIISYNISLLFTHNSNPANPKQ
jgi:hypothetical protein